MSETKKSETSNEDTFIGIQVPPNAKSKKSFDSSVDFIDVTKEADNQPPEVKPYKTWKQYLEVAVCGSSLLSDGYCLSSIGMVITILKKLYPKESKEHHNIKHISTGSYIGTIVGQLFFGVFSDVLGRKAGMITSTVILIIATALCAGAYGYHGSINGMMQAMIAYRFFLGIGVGAEFVCGSISASESSAEIRSGIRHAIFVIVTDTATVVGHVLGALVPYILACIFGQEHLRIVWRLSIGFGVILPIVFLILRLRMKEVKAYTIHRVSIRKVPWLSVAKMYGPRLCLTSIIWFANDLIVCAFSLYSSSIIKSLLPSDASIARTFGWTVLIQAFSVPGSLLGAYFSDVIGPKYCLIVGMVLQGTVGFFMSGFYPQLIRKIAGFCVLYGVFLSLSEFGVLSNIRLLSAKTSPTPIRGLYCGIAVTAARCGAIAGIYVFGGDQLQKYFYVASGIYFFIAFLSFFLPNVGQSCVETENDRFLECCVLEGIDPKSLRDNPDF
ncbi:glycerophosphodiester transporter [Schizosaccharomyces osmophilus]|uniref:Glycerophosphodiester transporter n=1 Tax=Schizosaccharomyces osmophilus TaxID=2545709 RepID=A0AAF0AUB3_9SCHI|nr:glycerophosphodiester transporter [Schizosaccharomyces osmophilus]WBW70790.1 glycerophosphodiester transporter [Schizosaccharomyces osmophilus]